MHWRKKVALPDMLRLKNLKYASHHAMEKVYKNSVRWCRVFDLKDVRAKNKYFE